MASAVLANHQGENDWRQPRTGGGGGGGPKFMGKSTFPKSNSNPNSNRIKKRQLHQTAVVTADDMDESPAVTQSAASDDASSINRRPGGGKIVNNDSRFGSSFVSFSVSSFSKSEAMELKERLMAELEQVRQLRSRIEAQDAVIRSNSGHIPVKKGFSKKMAGNKRPLPLDLKKLNGNLMKSCGQILTKLMKHKLGYIFNSPVDVVGLGLHDYYDIIKNPMDLGTVKSKLAKGFYDSPLDFAADVRLTFNNAMVYNPKGHDVYNLAEQLLSRFEDLFRPVNGKIRIEEEEGEEEERAERVYEEDLQGSSWDRVEPERVKKEIRDESSIQQIARKPEQVRVPASVQNPSPSPPVAAPAPAPAPAPSPSRVIPPQAKPLKQPKPRAKDPNKREMSLEEKHKLGIALQNLPPEKMENVVHIIKKRNGHLTQDGDEIELDIEAVDTETLWELDRFVTNYKKMVSKMKRQALMGSLNNVTPAIEANRELPATQRIDVGNETKKVRKGEAGEEDVDIGDEMPMSSFPPVEIEKDNGHASDSSNSSSSSSSDSSSGSDSDSGSSSGSDSDADDARS